LLFRRTIHVKTLFFFQFGVVWLLLLGYCVSFSGSMFCLKAGFVQSVVRWCLSFSIVLQNVVFCKKRWLSRFINFMHFLHLVPVILEIRRWDLIMKFCFARVTSLQGCNFLHVCIHLSSCFFIILVIFLLFIRHLDNLSSCLFVIMFICHAVCLSSSSVILFIYHHDHLSSWSFVILFICHIDHLSTSSIVIIFICYLVHLNLALSSHCSFV